MEKELQWCFHGKLFTERILSHLCWPSMRDHLAQGADLERNICDQNKSPRQGKGSPLGLWRACWNHGWMIFPGPSQSPAAESEAALQLILNHECTSSVASVDKPDLITEFPPHYNITTRKHLDKQGSNWRAYQAQPARALWLSPVWVPTQKQQGSLPGYPLADPSSSEFCPTPQFLLSYRGSSEAVRAA